MQYDRSTAYDYKRIGNGAAPSVEKQNRAVIKRLPVKRRKPAPAGSLLKKLAVAGIILFMVCFNIYTRAEITDTKTQISKTNTKISELESEQTRLDMEMENLISYSNLEEEATKLGMQKKSKSQIHYIDTSDDDRAEIVGAK